MRGRGLLNYQGDLEHGAGASCRRQELPPCQIVARARGRDARRTAREKSGAVSKLFITRNVPLLELASLEALEMVEANADLILEEIGIEFRDDEEALALLKGAGADVKGTRVHFPKGLCKSLLATAPAEYTQHARNPAPQCADRRQPHGVRTCLWSAVRPRSGQRSPLRHDRRFS